MRRLTLLIPKPEFHLPSGREVRQDDNLLLVSIRIPGTAEVLAAL